jgi:hypothetical protein
VPGVPRSIPPTRQGGRLRGTPARFTPAGRSSWFAFPRHREQASPTLEDQGCASFRAMLGWRARGLAAMNRSRLPASMRGSFPALWAIQTDRLDRKMKGPRTRGHRGHQQDAEGTRLFGLWITPGHSCQPCQRVPSGEGGRGNVRHPSLDFKEGASAISRIAKVDLWQEAGEAWWHWSDEDRLPALADSVPIATAQRDFVAQGLATLPHQSWSPSSLLYC